MRILVVDDHDFTRSITVRLLRELGATDIGEASDGAAALEAARGAKPDIVVSDLNMPGMDGMTFIRHLAKDKLTESLIVCSGLAPAVLSAVESLAVVSGLRVLGVVKKPLQKDALAALLHIHANPAPAGGTAEIDRAGVERGIALGEVSAWFAPMAEVASRKVIGFSLHPRWQSKVHGLLSGHDALAPVDSAGGGPAVFRVMARAALSMGAQRKQLGRRETFFVPMGAGALADDALIDWAQSQLHTNQLPAAAFGVTIDGSAFAADPVAATLGVARSLMHSFVAHVEVRSAADLDAVQALLSCTAVRFPSAWVQAEPALFARTAELARRTNAALAAVGVAEGESLEALAAAGVQLVAGDGIGRAAPADEAFSRDAAR